MIEVVCPHCGADSRWRDARWGENAHCPACGRVITVVPPALYRTLERERERLRTGKRQTLPLVFVLEDIRSAYNVGSILRTADGCGVAAVYLTGITPDATHPKVRKTALGAEDAVRSQRCGDAAGLLRELREAGYRVYALEGAAGAKDMFGARLAFPAAFVFGNEVAGVSPGALAAVDQALALPMLGVKVSLNVAAAAAAAGYLALDRWLASEQAKDA